MACYEFRTLLPENATALELALEETLRQKYCTMDMALVQALSDPWKCPPEFLDWLALGESVDVWNDRWPEDAKRRAIANAPLLHKRKGTTGGVRDALAALGVRMSMISWHEMEPEGEVGTASFELWINDNINPDAEVMLDRLMIRDIVQTIERNKRLSVHYDLTIGVELTTTLRLAASAQFSTQMDMNAEHTTTRVNTQPAGGQLALSGHFLTQMDIMAEHVSTRINAGFARMQLGLSAHFTTITYMNAVSL